MKNEFIPYQQALELKELGFDEPCMCFYNNRKELKVYHNADKDWNTLEHQLLGNSKITLLNTYSAPTYSQAFRWFREKHNLGGEVHCIRFNSERLKGYQYAITSENYRKFEQRGDYHTYEEAESACLNKLIEIVKQQTHATTN